MLTLLLLLALAAADEPPPMTSSGRKRWRVWRPAKARQLTCSWATSSRHRLRCVEKPLLRWSNPTAGSVFGEVYLWTVHERPVAIASIYRWYHPFKDSTVEVVSITDAARARPAKASACCGKPRPAA